MEKWFLISLILVGGFLRIFMLGSFPVGVTGDELQQGYTAYSLLKTGRDEWGDFLPINPRGFGDYKPPVYSYLTIPSILIFGLNEFAIRFPAALASTICILVSYLLVLELFKNKRIALFSALFLTFSGWNIILSRLAWESRVGALFFLLGFLFFLKGLKKQIFLAFSALCFGLSIFSYHSYKVFVPFFLLGLLFIYRKEIFRLKRVYLVFAGVIFSVFILALIYGSVFSGGSRRAADAALFNPENLVALRNTQIEDPLPQPWGRVVNNKIEYVGTQFIQNYLGYFSTSFLFSPNRSNSSLFNLPGDWLFSVWEMVVIILGVYILVTRRTRENNLLVLWLLLGPIPAALTREYMHTQRVVQYLYAFPIVGAIGLNFLFQIVKPKFKFVLGLLLGFFITWSLVTRADFYLFHFFKQDLGGIKYGYKEVVSYTEENKDKYDEILFTKANSQPQVFVAFYTQMDPTLYQNYSKDWVWFERDGFKFLDMINYKMGKYYFRDIKWNDVKDQKNTLIVGADEDIPDVIIPQKIIKSPTGKVLFKIVDTNEIITRN